jgi:hypothetical protein
MRQSDPEAAILMRGLADRFDEEAWDAREVGDEDRYELMFRLSRAVSALAFALSEEPDEANYEAAYVVFHRVVTMRDNAGRSTARHDPCACSCVNH